MTREEAIQIIESSDYFWLRPNEKESKALNMAEDALRNYQDCVKCEHYYEAEDDAGVKSHCKARGNDSDLISRDDAMGAVQDHFNANGFKGYDDGQKMMDRIKALPSAEPVDCTDFICWIRDKVMDEEDWEMNAVAYGEVICRKLKKIGAVFSVGGYYHSADRPTERTGEWIEVTNGRGGHECSECHSYAPSYASGDEHLSDFCPNCGAKMNTGCDTESEDE